MTSDKQIEYQIVQLIFFEITAEAFLKNLPANLIYQLFHKYTKSIKWEVLQICIFPHNYAMSALNADISLGRKIPRIKELELNSK